MFQYAAASALASRLQTTLQVDTSALDKKTETAGGECQLDVFQLEVDQVFSLKDK